VGADQLRSSTSRLNVNGTGGNDYFAVDDNSGDHDVDGGTGDATFQIARSTAYGATPTPTRANLAAANVFDVATIATTRAGSAAGPQGRWWRRAVKDTFTVYSNKRWCR